MPVPAGTGRRGGRPRRAADPTRPLRIGYPVRFSSVLAAAVAGAALLLSANPAAAAPTPPIPAADSAALAGGFLARQLVDGTHYVFAGSDIADVGLTADGVFGMAAAHTAGAARTAATGYLADNAAGYADAAGSFGGPFPGSYAKLALVAEVTGGNPHAFGGLDLLAALRALECPAGAQGACAGTPGLFRNATDDGGFPNVITQALAVLALARSSTAADHPSQAAVGYLLSQRCADGGFPTDLHAAGGPCTSEVDSTGFAVLGLVAAGADVSASLAWLRSVRAPDGSYAGVGDSPSANSAAMAAQAQLAAGEDASLTIGWLRSLQVGCEGTAEQRGAITLNGTFDDSAVRATTQAAVSVAGVALTTLTAAGGAEDAPALDCPAPPTSTPPTSTAPASTPPASTPPATPPATTPPAQPAPLPHQPELADTNAADGGALVTLGALGAVLILAGAGAVVATRRRT
jgi:cell division septation protein DedD